MSRMCEAQERRVGSPDNGGAVRSARDHGFTLVEVSTSVAVLAIVLAAAWLLLTVSNDNLNRIDYGGQASESNRAAMASFERDLGHAMIPDTGDSPVISGSPLSCSFLADVDADSQAETVTWRIDPRSDRLMRAVTEPRVGGVAGTTKETVALTGVDLYPTFAATPGSESTTTDYMSVFRYRDSATTPLRRFSDPSTTVDTSNKTGVIELRLRNGMPDPKSNVIDRTSAFRIIAYVINGY